MPRTRPLSKIVALLLALTVLAAACGDDNGDGEASGTTTPSDNGGSTTTEATVEPERCPVGALDETDGPVTIDFWHGMTAELETTLVALTEEYNASQDRVRVNLIYQGSYDETAEKYLATARGGSLPSLVQLEETRIQMGIDSRTMLPVQSCIEAAGYDTSDHLPAVIDQFTVEGQLWPMPFNASGPVLYYNKTMFEAAGLTDADVPTTLDELREVSQTIVDSGVTPSGLAFELRPWYLEQWLAMGNQPLVDNDNGRAGRATATTFDSDLALEIFTFVDEMIDTGLATNVGRNPSGVDAFLAVANEDVAMAFGTSAALGSILAVLDTGQFPNVEIGVAPLPGPSGGGVLVGGAALWLVERDQSDAEKAAAWDYVAWLNEPEQQAAWHAGTGYIPIRQSAIEDDAVQQLWEEQPYFRVGYDQLLASDTDFGGPVVGDYAAMRDAIIEGLERMILQDVDPATALADAKTRADQAISAYNQSVQR